MRSRTVILAVAALFVLAQLVPVSRSNPPVEQVVEAPPEVLAVLERSCYDCHSHAVRWPWYSRVAPVSWLVAYDVSEAREHLNFSTWGRYDREEREENLEEIAEVLEQGEMPLWYYLPLHRDARLSDADLAALLAWTGPADGPADHGDEHGDH